MRAYKQKMQKTEIKKEPRKRALLSLTTRDKLPIKSRRKNNNSKNKKNIRLGKKKIVEEGKIGRLNLMEKDRTYKAR